MPARAGGGRGSRTGARRRRGDLINLRPERRTRTRRGDLRYSLADLADTVRDITRAELRLLVAGEDLHVGTVRTQPIAEDVVPDGTGLLLRGLRHPGELTARLYQVLAPWRQPLRVPVDGSGRIPLPAAWRSAGPLVMSLRSKASDCCGPIWTASPSGSRPQDSPPSA
ncbi:hypothetical protein ACWC4E_19530 [Streptomyces sp. NPDC001273]|uniref:hypothetical protein n=1 Tax=unclassified Streptomyces TaxID=2593676 RepID=UPI0011B0281D|nr:hypothetical protein [Streptomyces sp. SM1]